MLFIMSRDAIAQPPSILMRSYSRSLIIKGRPNRVRVTRSSEDVVEVWQLRQLQWRQLANRTLYFNARTAGWKCSLFRVPKVGRARGKRRLII